MLRWQWIAYFGLLAGCWLVSLAAGWTTLGIQLDNDVYDFLYRIHSPPPAEPRSVILGIDEESLREMGGQRALRRILAEGLERIAAHDPAAVVVDMILADPGDPGDIVDARLEAALAEARNLVLATGLTKRGVWEDPLPRFGRSASAVGHIHADPDPYDNVVRAIPLEKSSGRQRRFALALEAYRRIAPNAEVLETPSILEIGGLSIPAARADSRPMLIRYRPLGAIPEVTFYELRQNPAAAERLRGKVVLVGITAQSAAQDRHMTPYSYGQTMPGVEIHANAFETIASGRFLRPAGNLAAVVFCLLLSAAAGLVFARFAGWPAYLLGAGVLAVAHAAPYLAFRQAVVFPYAAPLGAAWLSVAAAASFQHFVVRRMLLKSEAERDRYQKAIHFVAHEMRTPLTAIQGSSELMGRYRLSEDKRAEIARMINSESKRLARMIQTFLDVERLSEGQIDLKREPFDPAETIHACLERARPLAEDKRIRLQVDPLEPATLHGDRELMEYAVYNLVTNAIKYSPPETEVTVSSRLDGEQFRLSVRDEGVGMDETELGRIFQKFYRTRKAETSGVAGTGIGLSIVEQIVTHHGGKMEVTSQPGAGSCFTMVLPAKIPARG